MPDFDSRELTLGVEKLEESKTTRVVARTAIFKIKKRLFLDGILVEVRVGWLTNWRDITRLNYQLSFPREVLDSKGTPHSHPLVFTDRVATTIDV